MQYLNSNFRSQFLSCNKVTCFTCDIKVPIYTGWRGCVLLAYCGIAATLRGPMNSSCSFTMESNCWTLLMSYSKFVLVLLATNVVYSSISIPFPTLEPASSQPPVPASSQLQVPVSSQTPVTASSQTPVTASSQTPVTASSQPWPPVPASSQLPCQGPGADPGFQKGGGGGGGG